jgi:hypothetical protein
MGLPPGLIRLRREKTSRDPGPASPASADKNTDGYDGPSDRYDGPSSGYDGPRDRSGSPGRRYDGPEAGYDGPDPARR